MSRCVVLFFAALALCAARDPVQSGLHSKLAVLLRFDQPYPARLFDSMQAETERILLPTGIPVAWLHAGESEDNVSYTDIVVVDVHGKCSADAPATSHLRPYRRVDTELGSTNVTDGAILPYGAINCDRVGSLLGPALREAGEQLREEVLGRALGRVLAHELRHMLLQLRGHSRGGIGKGYYSTEDLISPEIRFTVKDVLSLEQFWQSISGGGAEATSSGSATGSSGLPQRGGS